MLKILCLHGGRQTAEIFENQLAKIQSDLVDVAEFYFIDAPFVLEKLQADDAVCTRSWCSPSLDTSVGDAEATEEVDVGGDYTAGDSRIDEYMTEKGPFDVLLGFSQGGLMALRYLARQALKEVPDLFHVRGIIIAGTPDPWVSLQKNDLLMLKYKAFVDSQADYACFSEVPSLHLVGKKDAIVRPEESKAIARAVGPSAELLEHEHAHSVPQQEYVRRALRNFLATLGSSPAQVEEDLQQRAMELEMVSSMYEGCVTVAAAAGGDTNEFNQGPVGVVLPLVDEGSLGGFADGSTAQRVLSHLHVRFDVPLRYPRVYPSISVVLTDNDLHLHHTALERWKSETVAEGQRYLLEECSLGDSMLLPCYLALCELTQQGLERLGAMLQNKTENNADTAEEESRVTAWDLEDEEERSANIKKATLQAERLLSRSVSSSSQKPKNHADNSGSGEAEPEDTAAAAASGGGRTVKTLTIGLIGKPSAGKSTFFNAITDPQSEADAARVAAFPFTTIEPNVGTGFAPVPCCCGVLQANNSTDGVRASFSTCDAEYGHVRVERPPAAWSREYRRHPVIVKDVAGLVKGAYEGKGKGNQFLNDLCDADVLVHVVDGAAATEADGTACNPGEGSTLEDIEWVRAEVHSWIYDNLRSKWISIARQPQKLKSMFTGYHSSPSFVEGALQRLGVPLDALKYAHAIKQWGPAELHLLVAVFVRLRFPMVVALNKADLPSARAIHDHLHQRYPGEVFVPMSAQMECHLLRLRSLRKISYVSGDSGYAKETLSQEGAGAAVLTKQEEKECLERLALVEQFFSSRNPQYETEKPTTREILQGSTGVQVVLAHALSLCSVVFVYPVSQLPVVSSLHYCLSLKKGATAEELFNVMCHKKWIDGKYVRCETIPLIRSSTKMVNNQLDRNSDVVNSANRENNNNNNNCALASIQNLKKIDALPGPLVIARILSNKRQLN